MADSKRFLRNPTDRNILYWSADGHCQHCGDPLPDGWNADHIEPWAATHTTNLFDMVALCPKCNNRKGAKMNSSVSINMGPMRPGQRAAVQEIWTIRRTGLNSRGEERNSATIVLPTRYGKTDVIRASAVGLMVDNLASRAVILEPASNLVSQVLDSAGLQVAVERYSLPFGYGLQTFAVRDTPKMPFPPRFASSAHFLAMTTQMANSNRDFFSRWVKDELRRHGCPPVWYIDECHTGSRDNEWGKTVRALQEAGAFLVLLTATPYRTDMSHVEGFAYTEVGRDTHLARLGSGLWEREHIHYELRPDHATTFKEAWNERPQSLCFLGRVTIDAPLNRYQTLTGERREGRLLSQLSHADALRTLGRLVRDSDFIRDATARFMDVLNNRRAVFEDTAGMVYVGSDEPGDEANAHASQVVEALRAIDPRLNIVVATSSTEDATERLRAFQQGEGDVLVVKQMGGVGMDVPRLKVCLDLSTVRTLNAFVQRVCRTATMWNPTGDPEDMVRTATYISPADAPAKALWDEFVEKEGGNAETRVTLEFLGEVEGEGGQQPLPDTFVLAGTAGIGDMVDSQQRSAPGEQWPVVNALTCLFPEITASRTEAEIANIATDNGIVIGGEAPATPQLDHPVVPTPIPVVDLYAEQKAARAEVVNWARRAARKRQGGGALDEKIGEVMKQVYIDHKQRCGLGAGTPIDQLDVDQLHRLRDSIRREVVGT